MTQERSVTLRFGAWRAVQVPLIRSGDSGSMPKEQLPFHTSTVIAT